MARTNHHRGRNRRRRTTLVGARARRDGARSSTTTRRRSIACAGRSRWAGGNEADGDAARQHERRRERHGQPRADAAARKVLGILRDALRQKSMGIIEEIPDKGIVKYAKPAGVIALADSGDQPVRHADRHRDLRDQVQGRGDLLAASRRAGRRRSRPCA